MGVVIPDDVRVLSSEFKDFVLELASEVNRVSEAYADLQRVRANTDGVGSGGGQSELLFYQVSLDGGSPFDGTVTLSGSDAIFVARSIDHWTKEDWRSDKLMPRVPESSDDSNNNNSSDPQN